MVYSKPLSRTAKALPFPPPVVSVLVFTFAGIAMMAAAVILLITSKKKKSRVIQTDNPFVISSMDAAKLL